MARKPDNNSGGDGMEMPWSALTDWIKGVKGTVVGIGQYRRAKKLLRKGEDLQRQAEAQRTDFKIPDEIKNNYQTAQSEAFGKQEIQQQMENSADAEQSANLAAINRYATSGADALSAASGANQQTAVGYNQAAIAGAQSRQQNMGNMYEAGNLLADYKSMAWDMNVNIPYLQRMQWAMDLQGAGYQGKIDASNTMI